MSANRKRVYRVPLSQDEITRINKERGHDEDIKKLVKEIKRLKRAYVGEELICMSPIAERAGKKAKICVNRLNEDAGIAAIKEGVAMLFADVSAWSSYHVSALDLPEYYVQTFVDMGIETVGELLTKTDKDIQISGVLGDFACYRIRNALQKIGAHE